MSDDPQLRIIDPADVPTPDVVGDDNVTCPCGALTVMRPSGVALSVAMKCPGCHCWVEAS